MDSLGAADPRSIGGYPLFARLGAGGMGQVFLARTPAGRPLALKTVRGEYGGDAAFGERFAREIRSADLVRSPWTAVVVDYSPAGSGPQWLATEYVAAPSLADWVAHAGPLPQDGLVALAAELCEGLQAVHRAGLAHRDVKPSNVLLPRTRPLLIDFGIARAAEDSRHTRTGGVIGSPGYMAPEQATAGVSAEPGDVFALGAVLVYAATGRGPFHRPGEEASTPSLLYRVVHEEPDLTGVPEPLLPFVRACLGKDPAGRPSARAAAALLPVPAPDRPPAGPEADPTTDDPTAGVWAAHLPPGLEADIATREAEAASALADAAPATGAGTAPSGQSTPSGLSAAPVGEAAPAAGTGSPGESGGAAVATPEAAPSDQSRPSGMPAKPVGEAQPATGTASPPGSDGPALATPGPAPSGQVAPSGAPAALVGEAAPATGARIPQESDRPALATPGPAPSDQPTRSRMPTPPVGEAAPTTAARSPRDSGGPAPAPPETAPSGQSAPTGLPAKPVGEAGSGAGGPATFPYTSPYAPAPAAATGSAAPAPAAGTGTVPYDHPAYRQQNRGQSAPQAGWGGPAGGAGAGTGVVPPQQGGQAGGPAAGTGPGSRGPNRGLVAVAAVAGVVVLVLAGLLVRNLADSGKGGRSGGSTGGTDGPSTSASAPTTGAADPDALPASWVGTWTGSGPGDPAGSATAPRTDSFKVTLTLVAGRRGDRLGRQVSNAHDADTGADDGCTETLQLTSMNGSTATFTAVSARPTDSSGAGVCLPGNVYQVSMAGGKLHLGAGSQAPGAPSTFTKVG